MTLMKKIALLLMLLMLTGCEPKRIAYDLNGKTIVITQNVDSSQKGEVAFPAVSDATISFIYQSKSLILQRAGMSYNEFDVFMGKGILHIFGGKRNIKCITWRHIASVDVDKWEVREEKISINDMKGVLQLRESKK